MKKRPLAALGICLVLWILICRLSGLLKTSVFQETMDEQQISCEGTVFRMEEKNGTYNLYLKNLSISGKKLQQKARIIVMEKTGLAQIGNRIEAYGVLALPQKPGNDGQFDAKAYYAVQGISGTLRKATIAVKDAHVDVIRQRMFELRQNLKARLEAAFSKEEAGILMAVMLGDKSELEEDTLRLFQSSGIAHILAISGLHVSLIGMGLYGMLRKISCSFAVSALISGNLLIGYGMMTGFSVSTRRAVIMFALYLGAQCLGRTYDMTTALAVSMLLILMENPMNLFYAGFQMSALAIASLSILAPAYATIWKTKILTPLALQLCMLPCMLWYYYRYPLYGIGMNLLILPFMSLLLISGIFSILGSFLLPSAAVFLGSGAHYILQGYQIVGEISQRLPGALLTFGKPAWWSVIVYYLVLAGGAYLLLKKCKKEKKIERAGVGYTAGYVILLLACICFLRHEPENYFYTTILDVGQGDCIFLHTKEGVNMLCDGGSSTVTDVGSRRILPYLLYHGVERIDYLFLSHMDADHYNGIEELLDMDVGGIKISHLVFARAQEGEEEAERLQKKAIEKGIQVHFIEKGEKIKCHDLTISCLYPPSDCKTEDKNEESMVLWVNYLTFDLLLTGDLEKEGEEQFLASFQRDGNAKTEFEVLKVGHHGSNGGTSAAFLDALHPEMAVLSYGKNNRYHHPGKQLIGRLLDAKIPYLETAKMGAISFYVKKGWYYQSVNDKIKTKIKGGT